MELPHQGDVSRLVDDVSVFIDGHSVGVWIFSHYLSEELGKALRGGVFGGSCPSGGFHAYLHHNALSLVF